MPNSKSGTTRAATCATPPRATSVLVFIITVTLIARFFLDNSKRLSAARLVFCIGLPYYTKFLTYNAEDLYGNFKCAALLMSCKASETFLHRLHGNPLGTAVVVTLLVIQFSLTVCLDVFAFFSFVLAFFLFTAETSLPDSIRFKAVSPLGRPLPL